MTLTPDMIIAFFKKLFFPKSYYRKRLGVLHNRFLQETEKDKLLASFASYLLPIHSVFIENGAKSPVVNVDKDNYPEIYKMGIVYYMGMRIIWD